LEEYGRGNSGKLFRNCCIRDVLNVTEVSIWDISELDCPDLGSGLEEYIDAKCENGCKSEEGRNV
jgi:hypothetical protein